MSIHADAKRALAIPRPKPSAMPLPMDAFSFDIDSCLFSSSQQIRQHKEGGDMPPPPPVAFGYDVNGALGLVHAALCSIFLHGHCMGTGVKCLMPCLTLLYLLTCTVLDCSLCRQEAQAHVRQQDPPQRQQDTRQRRARRSSRCWQQDTQHRAWRQQCRQAGCTHRVHFGRR